MESPHGATAPYSLRSVLSTPEPTQYYGMVSRQYGSELPISTPSPGLLAAHAAAHHNTQPPWGMGMPPRFPQPLEANLHPGMMAGHMFPGVFPGISMPNPSLQR